MTCVNKGVGFWDSGVNLMKLILNIRDMEYITIKRWIY